MSVNELEVQYCAHNYHSLSVVLKRRQGVWLTMCRPDYFEVAYAINPWMDPNAWSGNRDELANRSRREWEDLVRTCKQLGAWVELQAPAAGAPDMVFTANSAVVLDGKALLARFLDCERQVEEPHNAAFFEGLRARGLIDEVRALPEGLVQEGAGDCNWDATRGFFWAGYGQRSWIEAFDVVEDYFGRKAVRLELVDPRYYHVDTCLAPLNSGHILDYPPAFSMASLVTLEREAGGAKWLIPADEEDAASFSVNLVNIGNTLVMAACSLDLERRFAEVGFRVIRAPLGTFGLSGGAAFCLTLRLDHATDAARPRLRP